MAVALLSFWMVSVQSAVWLRFTVSVVDWSVVLNRKEEICAELATRAGACTTSSQGLYCVFPMMLCPAPGAMPDGPEASAHQLARASIVVEPALLTAASVLLVKLLALRTGVAAPMTFTPSALL